MQAIKTQSTETERIASQIIQNDYRHSAWRRKQSRIIIEELTDQELLELISKVPWLKRQAD